MAKPPAEAAQTVRIHRARPADAETVAEMVSEIAAEEASLAALHTDVSRWRELLADPRVIVFLAAESSGPVGYASATHQLHLWSGGDLLALDDLYVRPAHRNLGLGWALMRAIAQHAADHGDLSVHWGLEPENTDAARFYRRLGAQLRPKVLAGWSPSVYRPLLASGISAGL